MAARSVPASSVSFGFIQGQQQLSSKLQQAEHNKTEVRRLWKPRDRMVVNLENMGGVKLSLNTWCSC